jgi:hypothetical protein
MISIFRFAVRPTAVDDRLDVCLNAGHILGRCEGLRETTHGALFVIEEFPTTLL